MRTVLLILLFSTLYSADDWHIGTFVDQPDLIEDSVRKTLSKHNVDEIFIEQMVSMCTKTPYTLTINEKQATMTGAGQKRSMPISSIVKKVNSIEIILEHGKPLVLARDELGIYRVTRSRITTDGNKTSINLNIYMKPDK